MAAKEKLRVRLKSYDHYLIDQAAEKVVDTAKHNGRKKFYNRLDSEFVEQNHNHYTAC